MFVSYGRNPYYIWSDGNELNLDGIRVNEDIINAFLYKVLLTGRRGELKNRLQNGKEQWLNKIQLTEDDKIEYISLSEHEINWMEKQEDEILKILMGK